MVEEKLLTNISYYNEKTFEVEQIKLCTIRNEFMFSRTEFILCSKKVNYYFCISNDGELFVVWSCPMQDTTPSEAMSAFRRKYLEANVDQDRIKLFLDKPKSYKKKYLTAKK